MEKDNIKHFNFIDKAKEHNKKTNNIIKVEQGDIPQNDSKLPANAYVNSSSKTFSFTNKRLFIKNVLGLQNYTHVQIKKLTQK